MNEEIKQKIIVTSWKTPDREIAFLAQPWSLYSAGTVYKFLANLKLENKPSATKEQINEAVGGKLIEQINEALGELGEKALQVTLDLKKLIGAGLAIENQDKTYEAVINMDWRTKLELYFAQRDMSGIYEIKTSRYTQIKEMYHIKGTGKFTIVGYEKEFEVFFDNDDFGEDGLRFFIPMVDAINLSVAINNHAQSQTKQ